MLYLKNYIHQISAYCGLVAPYEDVNLGQIIMCDGFENGTSNITATVSAQWMKRTLHSDT